jgi:hypothetical protein
VETKFHLNENIEYHCIATWIEYAFELKFGSIGFKLNWIEKKWNANWMKVYWKYILEYGVAKIFFLIDTNVKGHLSMPILILRNGLNKF